MRLGESGQAGHVLVDLRVVLHRARAERVEAGVHAIVQPAETEEVANHLVLRHLWKLDLASQELCRQRLRLRHIQRWQQNPAPPGFAAIEAEAGADIGRAGVSAAAGEGGHFPTAASPAARRSISSRVFSSVTQTSMPFSTCSETSRPPMM